MIKAGIIGATGYAGQELARLLCRHPEATIELLTSQTYAGQSYSDVFPSFRGVVDAPLVPDADIEDLAAQCDVIFMALPHGEATRRVDEKLLAKTKVIDIGSDFRLKTASDYSVWYEMNHEKPELLPHSVYGLPEWRRKEIRSARLIANPGCYATCTILSLAPMLKAGVLTGAPIVVDAKSGVSGAGRSLTLAVHFNECNETVKAYKVAAHRHTPEIEQEIGAVAGREQKIVFTPHLIPMNRGILVTAYAELKDDITRNHLLEIYQDTYGKEPFVRLCLTDYPETRWVSGSNYCDIGVAIDQRTNRAIVIGALDNLIKGAAGQAVQNMNLVMGIGEAVGLEQLPVFP